MKLAGFVLVAVALAGSAVAQHKDSSIQPNPAFDKMKTLVGEWEGTVNEGGKETSTRSSFRMVSDGSALMNTLGSGTPHEMITMFHMDGKELMATHYCAAHNQPRFRAVPGSDPRVVAFEFKDATNVATPQTGHMVQVKFTMLDPNHHVEEWTFQENGKRETGRFDFHRKK